jgi:hypothetical protein
VSSEPKNYAEQSFLVSLGWMVAFGPFAVSCPPPLLLAKNKGYDEERLPAPKLRNVEAERGDC